MSFVSEALLQNKINPITQIRATFQQKNFVINLSDFAVLGQKGLCLKKNFNASLQFFGPFENKNQCLETLKKNQQGRGFFLMCAKDQWSPTLASEKEYCLSPLASSDYCDQHLGGSDLADLGKKISPEFQKQILLQCLDKNLSLDSCLKKLQRELTPCRLAPLLSVDSRPCIERIQLSNSFAQKSEQFSGSLTPDSVTMGRIIAHFQQLQTPWSDTVYLESLSHIIDPSHWPLEICWKDKFTKEIECRAIFYSDKNLKGIESESLLVHSVLKRHRDKFISPVCQHLTNTSIIPNQNCYIERHSARCLSGPCVGNIFYNSEKIDFFTYRQKDIPSLLPADYTKKNLSPLFRAIDFLKLKIKKIYHLGDINDFYNKHPAGLIIAIGCFPRLEERDLAPLFHQCQWRSQLIFSRNRYPSDTEILVFDGALPLNSPQNFSWIDYANYLEHFRLLSLTNEWNIYGLY